MVYIGLFLTGVAIALITGFAAWLWMAAETCRPARRESIRFECGVACGTALCLLVFVSIEMMGRL